jgi:DNA-directed RNA polymerase subunit K/omega
MVYRTPDGSAFELVVVASLRNKQLVRGCLPRVAMAHKLTTTARLEVAAGKVVGTPGPAKVRLTPVV